MRFGDINKDGYPDMLLTLVSKVYPYDHIAYLLINSDCSGVEGFNSPRSIQGFILDNNQYGALNNISTSYATFFDFGEQGYLKRFF